jgi:beta-lactamase class A
VKRVALLTCIAAIVATAPASAEAPRRWKPDVAGARQYLKHRHGNVSFAVRTERRLWGHRPLRDVPAASVLKAMLMVAYLNHRTVRDRPLHRRDRRLLAPMIRRSDNASASAIRNFVGNRGLRRIARRLRMRRFVPVAHPWGGSRVNAANQTRLFLRIDQYVAARHRPYAMRLLGSITPSQRWGVGRVVPRGWRAYFKGGWGSGSGAVDHQVALLKKGRLRVAVAVMTTANGSHAYGKATLRGVFRRLMRGLRGVQSRSLR